MEVENEKSTWPISYISIEFCKWNKFWLSLKLAGHVFLQIWSEKFSDDNICVDVSWSDGNNGACDVIVKIVLECNTLI